MTEQYIISLVCLTLCLDRDKLLSNNKTRSYSDGRFIAMYLVREKIKVDNINYDFRMSEKPPLKKIAYIFKRENHASVIHALKEVQSQLKYNKSFKRKFDMVYNLLDCNLSIA